MKRKREPTLVENPFIKEENKTWTITEPESLTRSVSPPPVSSRRKAIEAKSVTAQIEAGEKDVEDHLSFFSSKLQSSTRPVTQDKPRIDHQSWIDLYTSNASNPRGHHFVIHQHDHPIAGTHYDLRLQCNETSSVSWAIMYGLPGDPNSRRLNRNATETRIHCLWNHLIETASHQTGTLLIWDTGVYEVLPRNSHTQSNEATTDEDMSDEETSIPTTAFRSEPDKLKQAFQTRKIRLRLHGTRLPENYTLSLWLRSQNDRTEQPAAPKTRRRKLAPGLSRKPNGGTNFDTDSDTDNPSETESEAATTAPTRLRRKVSSLRRHESPPNKPQSGTSPTKAEASHTSTSQPQDSKAEHSDDTNTNPTAEQDELIRQTNAYPGAINSINSIHQRRWFLCLDRVNSGFVKSKSTGKWVKRSTVQDEVCSGANLEESRPRGFEPFHVLGREYERSVVTGRLASEILQDERVVGYVPRGKWRAVTE